MVRAELRKLLERAGDIQIVGEAGNGREVLDLVENLQPDVLILDMEMPDLKGFEIIERLNARESPVQIMALSAYNDRQYMLKTLDYGAAAYLTKDASPQTLIDAVRRIARQPPHGEAASLPAVPFTTQSRVQLTDSEKKLLGLVASGQTVQQISLNMKVTEAVVTETIEVIFAKLEVHTSLEATGKAIQQGLI